jgi:hypothetical protein
LRLYWTQTVVFRLRQAASLTKEPEVVREIRRVATANRVRDLRDLAIAERTKLESRLARVLPINVIDAFHTSKPVAMPPLFTRMSKGGIRLTADTPTFLRDNAGALQALANLWWDSYLESEPTRDVDHSKGRTRRRAPHVRGQVFGLAAIGRRSVLFLLRTHDIRYREGTRLPRDSVKFHAVRVALEFGCSLRALQSRQVGRVAAQRLLGEADGEPHSARKSRRTVADREPLLAADEIARYYEPRLA